MANWNSNRNKKGERAEKRLFYKIKRKLDKMNIINYVYQDLLIPKKPRELRHTQLDIVILTQKATIIIEIKSMKGIITGKENNKYWYQTGYKGSKTRRLYNPIMQNQTHVDAIEGLNKKQKIIPIILFYNENNETQLAISANNYIVILEEDLDQILNLILNKSNYITKEELDVLNALLLRVNKPKGSQERKDHLKWVKGIKRGKY